MVEWEKPFASLRAWAGARATTPKTDGEFLSVAGLGLEPRSLHIQSVASYH